MQNAESIPQGRERMKSIPKKAIGALGLAVVMVGCGGGLLPVWAMTDASMIETTIVESELAGAPTVVTRLEREEQLGSYAGDIPASIILRVDAACNVVGEDGAVLGALTDIYADEIAGLMIPIVEIEDEAAAEALIGLWKSEWSISDMAVMSSDAQVLANVRSELTGIRGIYDVTGQTLSDEAALYEVVRTATLSMANVVLLSEAQSEPETVAYLQGRFKTVWTQLDEESEGDIFSVQNVVASGTYGIVCEDYRDVYAAYREYPERAVSRISLNIAHRGLPMTTAENSVAGAQAAVDAGASHIEIDVQFSKDGVPIIMHDGTIDRTTNGTGTVSEMTLEELGQYQITKTYGGAEVPPQPIPTLDDFLKAFDGTGVVIVCEIKTSDTDVLPAIAAAVEEYDFWDQLVFISFDLNMLAAAHEQLPQVPTAALPNFRRVDFDANVVRYNAMNTVVDAAIGDMGDKDYYDSMMKDRGYMSFFWTYGAGQDCVAAMASGVYGLTNNAASAFGERVGALAGVEGQTMEKDALVRGARVRIRIKSYAGDESEVNGTIFNLRDCGDYAEVIAAYTEAEDVLFTRAFRVDYAKADVPAGGENNTGLIIGCCVGGAVVLAAIGVGIFFAVKKKNSRKS